VDIFGFAPHQQPNASRMALNENQAGRRMWPSLETASKIADWANILLIGSLVVGVVSTCLIVWMANVKETHWAELRRQSDEKIADANARAKEAELQLQKLKSPRSLDIESFLETLKPAPPAKVEVLYVPECSDCSWVAQFIGGFLNTAKWEATWAPIDEQAALTGPWRNQPSAISVRGYPWGITVVAKDLSPEKLESPEGASLKALFQALLKSFAPGVTMAPDPALAADSIRVVVAPRP
jgi:hypothetical protein